MRKIKEIANLMKKDPIQIVKKFAHIYKQNLQPPQYDIKRKHFFYGSCD